MLTTAFLIEKMAARLHLIAAGVIRQRAPLPPFDFRLAGESNWHTLPYNRYWGEWQQDFEMRGRYQIPAEWPLDATIALDLPLGESSDGFRAHPEALIYVDDSPFTTVDMRHNRLVLPAERKDHAEHQLYLDGWTGLGDSLGGDERPQLYIRPCALVLIDDATHAFVVLARNALHAAQHLEAESHAQVRLLQALRTAFKRVDTRHPLDADFYASIPSALDALRSSIAAGGSALPVTVHAAGHAHIDTAWLWNLAQTRRKAARTFHTALHLMERFPAYHFSQSQPQLYEFVREDHPALFERIQAAAKAGTWEPMGGMWIEADCNVTGAESFVRQFVFGMRYFREHFGDVATPVLWLPDTFGFPATLPQIAAQAGIPYFFTTKLRWSEHNDFPHDSFWWQGLDGTRILAHITPTPMQSWLRMATYNAEGNVQSVIETWQRMKHKSAQQVALMAYGWGDGGGGPTAEMLENLATLRDFPAVPQVKQGKVGDFFAELEQAAAAPDFPVWQGELYLETHQGTLTSQAWIKRANREAERLLHEVEFLSAWAWALDRELTYPQAEIDAAWRLVLLNQFHDILPGSSIAAVYDDARQQYATIRATLEPLREAALQRIARGQSGDWLIVNGADVNRREPVELPITLAENQHLVDDRGNVLPTQATAVGTLVMFPTITAGLCARSITIASGAARIDKAPIIATPNTLENDKIRVDFNAAGDIIQITDKIMGKPYIPDGALANQFQLFEDRPLRFDAWNIDADYEDRMWLVDDAQHIEVVEQGALRATLKIVRQAMHSTITQHISLTAGADYLDFKTHIDWQERQMLLKVAFPVTIHAPQATYHVQWGTVERPTHRNTGWDAAKYEVAAHYGAWLTDSTGSAALLNDSKYAYDIRDNLMRLTLLKAPTYPDPEADRGQHEITYRLQVGHHAHLETGYALNHPLHVLSAPESGDPEHQMLLESGGCGIVETVKRADDGSGLIVRAYQAGDGDEFVLRCALPIQAAWRVNLHEEKQAACAVDDDNTIHLTLRPFEVVSLLLEIERGVKNDPENEVSLPVRDDT